MAVGMANIEGYNLHQVVMLNTLAIHHITSHKEHTKLSLVNVTESNAQK